MYTCGIIYLTKIKVMLPIAASVFGSLTVKSLHICSKNIKFMLLNSYLPQVDVQHHHFRCSRAQVFFWW
jgi:hypothetical protein